VAIRSQAKSCRIFLRHPLRRMPIHTDAEGDFHPFGNLMRGQRIHGQEGITRQCKSGTARRPPARNASRRNRQAARRQGAPRPPSGRLQKPRSGGPLRRIRPPSPSKALSYSFHCPFIRSRKKGSSPLGLSFMPLVFVYRPQGPVS